MTATKTAVAVVTLTFTTACGDDGQSAGTTPHIDPARFSTTIDNAYYPLPVGARWVYKERGEDGVERDVVTVTSHTRVLMGVTCVEVRDTARLDGELVEDTRDWYAQDAAGTVWYFGEDTKEYEDGKVATTAGSWSAGVDGAQPGIIMPARPRVGATYRQEHYAGEAEDMGEVLSRSDSATVPTGHYSDVVRTKDFTPLEPNVVEHKYYARGIGLVLAVQVRGGHGRAELVAHNSIR